MALVIRSVIWSPPAPGWIKNGWHLIWLESDSSYVVQILFSRSEQVPCRIS
ncbi:hypothetical protein Ddye_021789, partial [Dipteronia dyeriana]